MPGVSAEELTLTTCSFETATKAIYVEILRGDGLQPLSKDACFGIITVAFTCQVDVHSHVSCYKHSDALAQALVRVGFRLSDRSR